MTREPQSRRLVLSSGMGPFRSFREDLHKDQSNCYFDEIYFSCAKGRKRRDVCMSVCTRVFFFYQKQVSSTSFPVALKTKVRIGDLKSRYKSLLLVISL